MTVENETSVLLSIKELYVNFSLNGRGILSAINDITLDIYQGEILGLVGESGSGKTVLAHSILRLIPRAGKIAKGQVFWKGKDLLQFSQEEMRKIRGKEIAMIFQDPQSALNPVYSIGKQLISVIRLHSNLNRNEAKKEAVRLLKLVQMNDAEERLNDYPHQFSGGMCQRIMIAMALSCHPDFLVADEPTAALDVTIQAQIMELLKEIRRNYKMSILLISHDLGVVAQMCDRVAIIYLGRIVEIASADSIYSNPLHPYTQALIQSVPLPDPAKRDKVKPLAGELPSPMNLPKGCRFQSRCLKCFDKCLEVDPALQSGSEADHYVACHLYDLLKADSPLYRSNGIRLGQ